MVHSKPATKRNEPSNPPAPIYTNAKRRKTETAAKIMCGVEELFGFYKNSSSGMIDPKGIETLCLDLEIDHTDVRILMLAWIMKAKKQGYFTLDEWKRGFKLLRVDNILNLKRSFPMLEEQVRHPHNFRNFYKYSFQYCLIDDMQKVIDIETSCELLNLVLGSRFRPQVDSLIEYLRTQKDYKALNSDHWICILFFCDEISFPDLKNFNPNSAWPLILIDYVEWMRTKQS